MRRQAGRLSALLAVVFLAGCTGHGEQKTSQDAVQQAYLRYWQAALSSQASPSATADLGAVAVGPQLKADQALVEQRRRAGEHVTGSYAHRSRVTGVHAATATVRDCLTAHLTVVGPHGHQQVPAGPYAVRATLVATKGTWRVKQIAEDSRTCPAPAPAASSTSAHR